MRILKDVVARLGVDSEEVEYFDLSEEMREKLVSILWDEIYKEPYLDSLLPTSNVNPLMVQYEQLDYFHHLQREKEEEGDYEVCDIVLRLSKITEHKIQQIDEYYANSK